MSTISVYLTKEGHDYEGNPLVAIDQASGGFVTLTLDEARELRGQLMEAIQKAHEATTWPGHARQECCDLWVQEDDLGRIEERFHTPECWAFITEEEA